MSLFLKLSVACRLCVIYVWEDNDSNVYYDYMTYMDYMDHAVVAGTSGAVVRASIHYKDSILWIQESPL